MRTLSKRMRSGLSLLQLPHRCRRTHQSLHKSISCACVDSRPFCGLQHCPQALTVMVHHRCPLQHRKSALRLPRLNSQLRWPHRQLYLLRGQHLESALGRRRHSPRNSIERLSCRPRQARSCCCGASSPSVPPSLLSAAHACFCLRSLPLCWHATITL